MKKRIATFVSLLLIALAATFAASSPASARDGDVPVSCTYGSVCAYVNTQYRTNQGYELIPSRPAGTCVVFALRNDHSGMFNNTLRTVRLYKNTGCTGTDYKTFSPGWGHYQFSVRFGPTWDNSTDAIKFV